jgi:hypothetical protein
MSEYDTHFSIIFYRIRCEVMAPDEYSLIVYDDDFGMEIWFFDEFPVP